MENTGRSGNIVSMASARDDEAVRLAARLVDAVTTGDRDAALRLTQLLEAQLIRPERRRRSRREDDVLAFVAPPPVDRASRKQSTSSARQAVTAALAEIGVPCRARLVADYAEARFGERIEPRTFAGLRRDERRAWAKSSARPTYVVPALEGRFYQPIRGLLALSDWPLEQRLVGPWSERTDHLAATAQLARQLAWLNDRDLAVAQRLAPIVAGMARSIPGAVDGTELDAVRVEEAAKAERGVLASRDDTWRNEAASRAREQLTKEQMLWGATVGVVAAGDW